MIDITKDIEARFARGNEYEIDGVKYRIRNFCKYYKVRKGDIYEQYDIALYLVKDENDPDVNLVYFNL